MFTTNREAHLYFPPRAFGADATVGIDAVDLNGGGVPAPPGTARSGAFELTWQAALEKPATLDLQYAAGGGGVQSSDVTGAPVIYRWAGTWTRIGGTVDAAHGIVSTTISEPGRYVVLDEALAPQTAVGLRDLSFSPRAFSPRGNFANTEVAIGFTMGREASVDARVYNQAGRLVRHLVAGGSFGSGASLIRWDGRDENSRPVDPGLYIVTIQALGTTLTKTLAVVR